MNTTKQLQKYISNYTAAIAIIGICKELAPAVDNKVLNKRVTSKFEAAIRSGLQSKNGGDWNCSIRCHDNNFDIDVWSVLHYSDRFAIRIFGEYHTAKKFQGVDGRFIASSFMDSCDYYTGLYHQHIKDAENAIRIMPDVCKFLQSVVDNCERFDKNADIFTGLLCHKYDISRFLEEEARGE